MSTTVHRCSFCGAPLATGGENRVSCEYCGSENEIAPDLGGQSLQLARAAKESEDIQAEADAKAEILMEKMTEAMEEGNPAKALKYQEGMMRAMYAPTIHLYQSMGPGNPQVDAALRQIDEAIDKSMRKTAADWGVEYVPAAER